MRARHKIFSFLSLISFFLFISNVNIGIANIHGSVGIPVSYTIKGNDFICHVSYNLTGKLPIKIKRITNDKKIEIITIEDMKEEHAEEFRTLITVSKEFLTPFMPSIVTEYTLPLPKIRRTIRKNRGRRFAIFYQETPKATKRIIGYVGLHSAGVYDESNKSIDGAYALGAPEVINVKGVGMIVIKALFELMIVNGTVGVVVLATDKKNWRSINIAKKLGMYQDPNADKHTPWPYAGKRSESFIFHLSAQEWKEKFFKKNVVIFSSSIKKK